MDTTTPLHHDFKEFLRLLNGHNVEYLMIGGFAVAHHGHRRVTDDLDIWVSTSAENEPKVKAVLREFGFDPSRLATGFLRDPDNIIRMGYPPFRIEVHTGIAGVTFEDCARRAVEFEIDDVRIRCIGRDDLIRNKRAAGRHKDLDDANVLSRNPPRK